MRFFKHCLTAIILCIYCQESAAETNSTNLIKHVPFLNESEQTAPDKLPIIRPLEFVSIKKLVPRNSTGFKGKETKPIVSKIPTGDAKLGQNVEQKREIENGTFNPFESLFLFPILPFLFPPKEDNLVAPEGNELPTMKTDSKVEITQTQTKPFVFFDFAFNIRQIPLKNDSERTIDSKIINVKKLPCNRTDAKDKNKVRRSTTKGFDFFDDTPLFPDTELDEFLPKPDLFFPDLSFQPKPVKKLSRKKRDEKEPDMRNDLKFFLDAVDEAFTRTKKELERTDPILSLIKGVENSFGEEKKDAEDFVGELIEGPENLNQKLKVQNNGKKSISKLGEDLAKNGEGPMVIMDKVVKIGEFRLHDDSHDVNPFTGKERRDVKQKSMTRDNRISDKTLLNIIETNHLKEKNTREKTLRFNSKVIEQRPSTTESKQINSSAQENIRVNSKRNQERILSKNGTGEAENLIKMVDSVKQKLKTDFIDKEEKFKRKLLKNPKRKMDFYDDLKKNITEVLNQFEALVIRPDEDDLAESSQDIEDVYQGELNVIDMTEKEILNTKKRKKKEFPLEYTDDKKSERKIADLHSLFMTFTVPTIVVCSLALIICFAAFQAKGKLCRILFQPRKVYMTEDDIPPPIRASRKEHDPTAE